MTASDRLAAINQVLEHARKAALYKERLPATPLRSMEQLEQIPFTTKDDLRAQSPYGVICVPEQELLQYHETSATTGPPVSVWYSGKDLVEIREQLSGWGVGFTSRDRVLIRFPYGLASIGHVVHAAAQRKQACVVPTGSRTPMSPLPMVVEWMRRLQVTVLATLSLGALKVAETAEMAGLTPRRDFPHLRAICCAGEPLTPSRRQLVEEIWGVPVYDQYGMTETGPQAMDCPERQLHPWKSHFWMEVLDERLERRVAPGEVGQLVVTSLTTRATPMVRLVTGDRVRLLEQPCRCGQSTTLQVLGREQQTLRVRERPFDLWKLEEIVSQLPCRRFWKVAPIPDGLHFMVEQEGALRQVPARLLERLERVYGVRLRVDLVPKGTFYDRSEPVAFGLEGKPVYVCAPGSLPTLHP